MRAQQHPLWQKLRSYEFGSSEGRERFTARLARDEGWSQPFAERVVDEYLRFMFLGCASGAAACPSEQVDRAWHLHLTYTREYWGRFCATVLGTQFHHTPAGSGDDERAKHVAMYETTLAEYGQWFGHRPPTDIWPAAEQRFARETREAERPSVIFHSSDLEHSLGGKPILVATLILTIVAGLGATVLAHGELANPLNFVGQEFLAFYAICFFPAFIFGVMIRCMLRLPRVEFGTSLPTLSGYETAYLSQGVPGTIHATVAALVRRGTLTYHDKRRQLEVGIIPAPGDAISAQVIKSVEADKTCRQIVKDATPLCEPIRRNLTELGLLMTESLQRQIRHIAVLPIAMLLALGLMKICVGLLRDKPVSILVVFCIATTMATLGIGFVQYSLSERGSRALATMRSVSRKAEHGAFAAESAAGHPELVAAFGLFGLGTLYGTSAGPLRSYLPGGNTAGSGCGGSGCGGGGGGGGGCGGGGCGGCGGG